jgi:formamidopyrimidine-DNA glycosylase
LDLGKQVFVFEDTRYFGRLTLDASPLEKLGPEPFGHDFTSDYLKHGLKRSAQPIKIKLLDQQLVAGIGNIYASEALFRARLSPSIPARRLSSVQVRRLRKAICYVLAYAIRRGSTLPLHFASGASKDRLFYFGTSPDSSATYHERLRVYDRAGQPCFRCGSLIRRYVQAGRSTYFCSACQKRQG